MRARAYLRQSAPSVEESLSRQPTQRQSLTAPAPYRPERQVLPTEAYVAARGQTAPSAGNLAAREAAVQRAGFASTVPIGKTFDQLMNSLLYTPVGVFQAAKALGLDVRDVATGRDFTPTRTVGVGKAIASGIAEDIRNPQENPGYLLADVIGLLGGGVGTSARLGSATRAARQAAKHRGATKIEPKWVEAEIGLPGKTKRLETIEETVNRTLAEGGAVPESLLREYATVAKRHVGGTTSTTRAAGRGFARPPKRGLLPEYRLRKTDGVAVELEAEIAAVLRGPEPPKRGIRQGVREDIARTRAADRGKGLVGKAGVLIREASDAARAGIIYLRPAYLPNNWASNGLFNFVQMGLFAPVELGKTMVLSRRLPTKHMRAIDTSMGQGATQAILGTGTGYAKAISGPLTEAMTSVADRPFRRAAFLHEARRAGYRKLDDVKALLDEATTNDTKLREVSRLAANAQEEIVRFSTRLSEVEQTYLRNLLFIYSWTEGASRYGARFPLAHPVQFAASAQLGKIGEEHVAETLGDISDFLRGWVPVGMDESGNPLLSNATFLTPLGTGLDVGQAAAGAAKVLTGGDFNRFAQEDVVDLLNPLGRSYLEARAGGRSFPETMGQNIALSRLGGQLINPGQGKTFPGSRTEALGTFFAGSAFPRRADIEVVQESARRETGEPKSLEARVEEEIDANYAVYAPVLQELGEQFPDWYRGAITRRIRLNDRTDELRQSLYENHPNMEKWDQREPRKKRFLNAIRLAALAEIYYEEQPDHKQQLIDLQQAARGNPEAVDDLVKELEELLYLKELESKHREWGTGR